MTRTYPVKTIALMGLALSFAIPQSAYAADPKLEGTFSNWTTYSRTEGGEKICYAIAEPTTKTPASVRHGDIFFMVANWKSGAATEQPSFLAGYALKNTSPPAARVGSAKYNMYVSQNDAFIESEADERRLVKNMRDGSVMRVQAVSGRGTAVSYEFSLKGVTAALKKAKDSCA